MKQIICTILISCILLISGCSNDNQALKKENEQLRLKVSELQKDLNDNGSKISELQNKEIKGLTINYIQSTNNKRFIEKKCDLLALPVDNAITLNCIEENTVVTILDTANVNNDVWFYVSIPVYDTPANYKGWIKEADTTLYTIDKVKMVQSDIVVKKGEDIYEKDKFEDIKTVNPNKAGDLERGRIEEKKDGYVRIQCPGGRTIWAKETSVIYPEADKKD